jgi:hypothetical protein
MKATYYIGSGKNQIITDIFLMLPKLNWDTEITSLMLKWMSELPSKEYSTFVLLRDMSKKLPHLAKDISWIIEKLVKHMLVTNEMTDLDFEKLVKLWISIPDFDE